MKILYRSLIFFHLCLFSYYVQAQPGRAIKQPPKINNVLNATNKAVAKVKIHANSNSVYRSKNQSGTNKKPKTGEPKKEEELEKNSTLKKRKK